MNLQTLLANGVDGLVSKLIPVLPWPIKYRGAAGDSLPYEISDGLLKATQVALLLRQPLLLTGEPGVGKTTFADALATRLGLGKARRLIVKSTMTGRDLLYVFDDVSRFRDAAVEQRPLYANRISKLNNGSRSSSRGLVNYVQLNALGHAIVRAAGRRAVVNSRLRSLEILGGEPRGSDVLTLGQLFPSAFEGLPPNKDSETSVVLLDEIDKAPRDAPNDLLDEVEQMRFGIEELGIEEIAASPEHWPIVIITSNSERNLPDAFLRRCVFHNLELVEADLPRIILSRLAPETGYRADSAVIRGLIKIFTRIRQSREIDKPPSTGELIAAALLLSDLNFRPDVEPWKQESWEGTRSRLLVTLAKKKDDIAKVRKILEDIEKS